MISSWRETALVFIDTSAIVAILSAENDAAQFARAIEAARERITAPHVRLEACMVLATRLNRSPESVGIDFDALISAAQISVMPFSDEMASVAGKALTRFGKGRGASCRAQPCRLHVVYCCQQYRCRHLVHGQGLFAD